MPDRPLPHLRESGDVHMVEVGEKEETRREATAEAVVVMSAALADRFFTGDLPKGDALASVRLAGIMGAKQTPALIPLCHPIAISGITVDVESHADGVRIVATVSTVGRTGIEMEAMTAVSVAALALYDMVKGVERGVTIERIGLLHKSGGRSGTWNRQSQM